jgi:hypothetical protein
MNSTLELQQRLKSTQALKGANGSSVTRPRDMGFVLTVEARLRQELRNYVVELRQLAYTLPSGVGENDLLRLSERMRAAAD